MQGVVKVYDPLTGFGVIIRDEDRGQVFLRPGSLDGSIFRTLRQGQRVVFETEVDGESLFAATVRIGSDGY